MSAAVSATSGPVNGGPCACCCCDAGISPCCWTSNAVLTINDWATQQLLCSGPDCTGTTLNNETVIYTVISTEYFPCGAFCVRARQDISSETNTGNDQTKYILAYFVPGPCWVWNYVAYDTEEELMAQPCAPQFHLNVFDPNGCSPAPAGVPVTVQNCKNFILAGTFCDSHVYKTTWSFDFSITGSNCCRDLAGSCVPGSSADDGTCLSGAGDPFP